MRYFKAFLITEKPFVTFSKWADSIVKLREMGLEDDPLILPENEIPDNLFGVCPLDIVAGELIERDSAEMAIYEVEFNIKTALLNNSLKIFTVNNEAFLFDGKLFPMDESSRLYYTCIEKFAGNHKIMTTSNDVYNLNDTGTNIADFMEAYYTKLIDLTKHDI